MREAEYYQKKAEGYRREAVYYMKKARNYQDEAAYYAKKGDLSRARTYSRYAEDAMDDYNTQLRYAAQGRHVHALGSRCNGQNLTVQGLYRDCPWTTH